MFCLSAGFGTSVFVFCGLRGRCGFFSRRYLISISALVGGVLSRHLLALGGAAGSRNPDCRSFRYRVFENLQCQDFNVSAALG